MIDILQRTSYYVSQQQIKFKLCTAVIYYINVICLKQFHEKAIHNKI